MTDYESLLNDLLTAGVKCTLSGAVKLAEQAFYGEELSSPQREVVAMWESRTLLQPLPTKRRPRPEDEA